MSAKIHLGGADATMNDNGEWSCPGRKEIESYLNSFREFCPPQDFMPDPWQPMLTRILGESGAILLEHTPPAREDVEGLIH